MGFRMTTVALLATMLTLPAGPVLGQMEDEGEEQALPIRGELGLGISVSIPTGEFNDFVDPGAGIAGSAAFYLGGSRNAAIRIDGSFLRYGGEATQQSLFLNSPIPELLVYTQNSIVSMGIGPQIYLGAGPVRPYVYGTVGFSYFTTVTSFGTIFDPQPIVTFTEFDDITLALAGGGGIQIQFLEGRRNAFVDISARFLRNEETDYLPDPAADPTSDLRFDPVRSETDLVSVSLGVSVMVH